MLAGVCPKCVRSGGEMWRKLTRTGGAEPETHIKRRTSPHRWGCGTSYHNAVEVCNGAVDKPLHPPPLFGSGCRSFGRAVVFSYKIFLLCRGMAAPGCPASAVSGSTKSA